MTGDIIALSPPLIIERSQIDDLFTLLQDALQAPGLTPTSHRMALVPGVIPCAAPARRGEDG